MDAAVAAGFTRHRHTVAGPTGQPVPAGIAFDGTTAVVEVANTCGLALLPAGQLEPLAASSRGFGEAILFALSLNPARIVLALGGSASTDGGMGMLTALGYGFRDARGRQLHGSGESLAQIHTIRRTRSPNWTARNSWSPATSTTRCSGPAARRRSSDPKRAPDRRTLRALEHGPGAPRRHVDGRRI